MDSVVLSPFCFYEWAKTGLQFDVDQSVLVQQKYIHSDYT